MQLNILQLREFMDEKYNFYNRPSFIETDPVSIPHLFNKKEDIEIAAFFSATISWGQRPVILRNARQLMEWMDMSPYDFIMNAGKEDLTVFHHFVHRTFQAEDCLYFIEASRELYLHHGGLEGAMTADLQDDDTDMGAAISHFHSLFFSLPHPSRTRKHISDPLKNSAAKRVNMFLRWMVRKDEMGVDFGIWQGIQPSQLSCPLDLHSGRVARKLGLLERKQDDWKAVCELTRNLKQLDPYDPVKYDLALFSLGVFEHF